MMTTMTLRPLFFLLLLATGGTSLPAAPLSAEAQQKLIADLRSLHERQPGLRADFTEEKTSRLLKKPIVSSGTIAFEPPNKFRRDATGASPSITVNDGKRLTIYYPNFQQAEVYPLGQRKFFDDSLAALTAGFDFATVDQFYDIAASTEGDNFQLVLTPKRAGFKRILEKLNVELSHDYRVLSTQVFFPNGDHLTTHYTNPQRGPVPAGTFNYVPPAGTEITTPLGK